jgi:hypothetical protein
MDGDNCYLEHLGMVYNKFSYDPNNLKQEDIKRTCRQNGALVQIICQSKGRVCLQELRLALDVLRREHW